MTEMHPFSNSFENPWFLETKPVNNDVNQKKDRYVIGPNSWEIAGRTFFGAGPCSMHTAKARAVSSHCKKR